MTSKARDFVKRLDRLGVPRNLLRHPNTVVALGDSRVAQIHADGAFRNKTAYNHFSMGNALAGNRAILLKNLGVSGQRTDEMLPRLKQAIDTGAYVLYIHAGLNDIAQNYPTASTSGVTAFNNIRTMIDAAVAAGMLPLVVLDPGANNLSPAQITQLWQLNQLLREYAETCPHMVLFDLGAATYNLGATSTSAIALVGMQDGVHQANLAGYNGGKAFAQVLMAIMPPRPHGVRSSTEIPANSPVYLTQNPMFTNNAGGGLGTGITGTVCGFWSTQRSGAATATASVGVASDGSGLSEQIMQATFTAAGEEVRVVQDVAIGLWNPGDILQAHAEVAVDAGNVNLAGVMVYLQANGTIGGNAVPVTAMDGYCIGMGATTTEAYKVNLSTEKLIVPNFDVKSWVTLHIKAVGAGAGSATFRVRRGTVKKRYS